MRGLRGTDPALWPGHEPGHVASAHAGRLFAAAQMNIDRVPHLERAPRRAIDSRTA